MLGGRDTLRLPQETGGLFVQPGTVRNIPRAREAHRAPRGRRRAERPVVHDPGGRPADGMQHVRAGGRAAHRGHLVFLDALQRRQDPDAVQDHPPSGHRGKGAPVGPRRRVLAGPGLDFNGYIELGS